MSTSKISKKGLTTVPKEIRESLELNEGDRLAWSIRSQQGTKTIEIVPIKDPYTFLKGIRSDENLTYDKAEEVADRLILEEVKKGKGKKVNARN